MNNDDKKKRYVVPSRRCALPQYVHPTCLSCMQYFVIRYGMNTSLTNYFLLRLVILRRNPVSGTVAAALSSAWMMYFHFCLTDVIADLTLP